jgi:PAS domain S-box-containing protein
LLLIEEANSPHRARIAHAAQIAGLVVLHVDSVESPPPEAVIVAVGPSVRDPLQVARDLRQHGGQTLLVFFAASNSARGALHAELIRDPFIYRRYEIIDIQDSPRQLATRLGRLAARIKPAAHAIAAGRQARRRPRGTPPPPTGAAGGENYLANILAQAKEAIFSLDENGRILTWNRASEDLFGITRRAALGQPASLLDSPEPWAQQLGAIVQRVSASGEAEDAQATCQRADGGSVQVTVSVAPIHDPRGGLLGLSIVARDDSEYRRIQDALHEANRQKDEFLAIMSHELRTPLTSILGYADMLLRGLSGPLPPLTNKYIGNVRSAGDRLLELVNGLLDYTRLEAGVERVETRPVDLSGLVGQAVQQCQAQARSKHIDLRLAVGKGVAARVEADEEKVRHVARSMLGNALKFTPEGGTVALHIGPDPDRSDLVRVTVTDSGIGMREEVTPRVWERFYQGDGSLTRPYGGMGLGLSIARHLVSLHGGTVGAASAGPGLGSSFWFSLPLERSS